MKIQFTQIEFPDHTVPLGALPNHPGAQACFYFYLQAMKMREMVGAGPSTQVLLETDRWMDTHYEQLARSVALMYGLESPDEFAKFWTEVKQEAWLCGLPDPPDSITRLCPRESRQ